MPMRYSDTKVAGPDIVGQRFSRGLKAGIDLGSNAALVELRRQVESEMMDKRSIIDRMKDEQNDSKSWEALDALIETLPVEDREQLKRYPRTAEGAELARPEVERLRSQREAEGSGAAESEKARAAVVASFKAQERRLTPEERKRFDSWVAISDPTEADVEAFRQEINDYRKAVSKGDGKGGRLAGESAPERAHQPKTSKELLDKAYQEYINRKKDADELALVARMVGADAPDLAGLSFREFLRDEWLPNVGRTFNPEVADSMLTVLQGGTVAGVGSRSGSTGTGAPSSVGDQVPGDLVRRAYEALDRIEKQIQELEARR